MNLNHFLKADREKAGRLIKSTQFLISELLNRYGYPLEYLKYEDKDGQNDDDK